MHYLLNCTLPYLYKSIYIQLPVTAACSVEQVAYSVVFCAKLRNHLEEELSMSLTEFKHFIDEEMITVMRQMDAPSQIFDYLYLGSEWNASNLDELKKIGYVLSTALMKGVITDLKQ